MAQSTISQRLAFEGLEDITKRLATMGETGQKAIDQIRTATGDTGAAFGRLSAVVNDLQGVSRTLGALGTAGGHAAAGVAQVGHAAHGTGVSLQNVSQHTFLLLRGFDVLDSRSIEIAQSLAHLGGVYTGLVGGLATIVIGIGAFSVAAAENTRTLVNQAAILGISIEKLEGMRFAAAQVGVSQEDLNRGLDRLSANLGKAQEAEKKLADELSITGEKNRIAVAKLGLAVEQQNLSLDRNAEKQHNLADAVTSARIAAEKAKDAFEHHSHSVEQANITAEKAQIAYEKLKDAFNTTGLSARDAREAQLNLTQAQLNAKEAQEGVQQAEKKRKEELLELGKAYEKIKQAEAAFTLARKEAALESKKAALALDEEKLKIDEIRHAGEQAKSVFEKLNVNIAPTRSQIEILEEFRDKLSKITNEAERNSLAREAYGRGFQALGAYIGIANDKMKEFEKLSEEFSFTANDKELAGARRLITAYETLKIALEGLKNAIGNIMGVNFNSFFDKVSHSIAENKDAIREFLTDTSAAFARWAAALGNLIPPLVFLFKELWAALKGIKAAFDEVADTINKFTGAKFTGEDLIVGIIAVRLALTGLGAIWVATFTAMGVAARAVGTLIGVDLVAAIVRLAPAFASLSIAAAPWLALLAAIVAVGAALVLLFGPIKQISNLIRQAFGDDAANAFDAFDKSFEDMLVKVGKAMQDFVDQAVKSFTEKIIANIRTIFPVLDLLLQGLEKLKNAFGGGPAASAPIPALPGAAPSETSHGAASETASGHATTPAESVGRNFNREAEERAAAEREGRQYQYQGRASGGWVGGSGSGDHVPVMAEPGEYVVNKRSSSVFGGLLQAINGARGFAFGGIVDSLNSVNPNPVVIPSGGAAARPGDDRALFHLTIGDKTFSGLSAPKNTADEMLQFARRSSVLSIGKKQSWYGS